MSKQQRVNWRPSPDAKDLNAAARFLSLINTPSQIKGLIGDLRRSETTHHAAKDLLRASSLALLPRDEPQVEADLKRVRKGKPLSPVLLVAGDMTVGIPLTVADGYHRICAVCYFNEDAPVSCRVVCRR
jgi:hypothetical protein